MHLLSAVFATRKCMEFNMEKFENKNGFIK